MFFKSVTSVSRAAFIDAPGRVFGTTGNIIGGLFGLTPVANPARTAAAVKLQSCVRRRLCAKRYTRARRAAVRVQKASRGHVARRMYSNSRHAATRIASTHRTCIRRKQFVAMRRVVVRLQSVIRRFLAGLAGSSRSTLRLEMMRLKQQLIETQKAMEEKFKATTAMKAAEAMAAQSVLEDQLESQRQLTAQMEAKMMEQTKALEQQQRRTEEMCRMANEKAQELEQQRRIIEEAAERGFAERKDSDAKIAVVAAELEAERAYREARHESGLDDDELPIAIDGTLQLVVEREDVEPERIQEAEALLGMLVDERLLLQEAREEFFESRATCAEDLDIDSNAYEQFGSQVSTDEASVDEAAVCSLPDASPSDPSREEDRQHTHALLDELVQRTERVHELQSALVSHLATPKRQSRSLGLASPDDANNLVDLATSSTASFHSPEENFSDSSLYQPLSDEGMSLQSAFCNSNVEREQILRRDQEPTRQQRRQKKKGGQNTVPPVRGGR